MFEHRASTGLTTLQMTETEMKPENFTALLIVLIVVMRYYG